VKTLKTLICSLAAFALLTPVFADDAAAPPADAGAPAGEAKMDAAPAADAGKMEGEKMEKKAKKHGKKKHGKKKAAEEAPAQ
jgi:hypothetical protein